MLYCAWSSFLKLGQAHYNYYYYHQLTLYFPDSGRDQTSPDFHVQDFRDRPTIWHVVLSAFYRFTTSHSQGTSVLSVHHWDAHTCTTRLQTRKSLAERGLGTIWTSDEIFCLFGLRTCIIDAPGCQATWILISEDLEILIGDFRTELDFLLFKRYERAAVTWT